MPYFRTSARLVSLAVKLPCVIALDALIANQPEGTFGRLRYSLGGDRPQSNYPAWHCP